MTSPLRNAKFQTLIRAWQKLQRDSPVALCSIKDDRHYREMIGLMNALLDKVGDHESHPLAGLLEIIAGLVWQYEDNETLIPTKESR